MEQAWRWIRRHAASIAFSTTGAVLGGALLVSVLLSIPPTVVTADVSNAVRQGYGTFIQQGWNFFTKDPQSAQLGVYQIEGNESLTDIVATPQTKAQNFWGLSRAQRAQGPELAFLAAGVAESDWIDCTDQTSACISTAHRALAISNQSPVPTVCGEVVITQQHQSPWSYRGFSDVPTYLVDKYVLLDVHCANGGGSTHAAE